jgi:hypothetical protein
MRPLWREGGPPICKANPGLSTGAAFARSDRDGTEEVDLLDVAASALKQHDYAVERGNGWLYHTESAFTIVPRIVHVIPLEDGGVRTLTTVQVNHPTLVPDGVFEFQHATDEGVVEAVSWGLSQWVELDFVTLLDSLRPEASSCATMEMALPEQAGRPARKRRAVLGPVAHLRQGSPTEASTSESEEHAFCPCCLFTNSFEAFRSHIEGDQVFCLRLLAQRDGDGNPGADCRVNGEDWEPGAEALRAYVATWPAAGFELRKQLVILQTVET